jgi:uncharacterized protein GlcG (DUF336 family)
MQSKPVLTLDDVKKIAAAAEAEAVKNNWAVAIAIVDDGGHLRGCSAWDGVAPIVAHRAIEGQDGRAGPPRVAHL